MFNIFHHWNGRVIAGLAIANVYIGLHLYRKWDKSPELGYILYSTLLGVIVGVGVLKARRRPLTHDVTRGMPCRTVRFIEMITRGTVAAPQFVLEYSYC